MIEKLLIVYLAFDSTGFWLVRSSRTLAALVSATSLRAALADAALGEGTERATAVCAAACAALCAAGFGASPLQGLYALSARHEVAAAQRLERGAPCGRLAARRVSTPPRDRFESLSCAAGARGVCAGLRGVVGEATLASSAAGSSCTARLTGKEKDCGSAAGSCRRARSERRGLTTAWRYEA
mgnify:CR=1 FL=1